MSFKKKNIAILGSTGSIGKTTLGILEKNNINFNIVLLCCNNNYKLICKQIQKFKPLNIYINDEVIRNKVKIKFKYYNYNFLKNLKNKTLGKFFKKKIDKTILAVPSITGINYIFNFLNFSKEILIANKESIICGGKLLFKEAKKQKCKLTSIDSEHYCISQIINDEKMDLIDSVYLTASGGPFLNYRKKLAKYNISKVISHPKWKMGKKISVDSATMVNKIFEMIEAHLMFNIPTKKIKIKIHKESLIHAAVVFKSGLVKMIMHDTSMHIPIRNSLYDNNYYLQNNNYFKDKESFNLTFDEKKLKNFAILGTGMNVLKSGHASWILFNTINDLLVNKFLNNKIFFYEIVENLIKIFSRNSTKNFCKKKISKISDIFDVINYGYEVIKKI